MDQFCCALSDTDVGCQKYKKCISSLSHADDMVLLTPTVGALQNLADVFLIYVSQHDKSIHQQNRHQCTKNATNAR